MVRLGLDSFLQAGHDYKRKKLALVTNHASLGSDHRPTRQALLAAGYNIVRLFSPEHGLEAIGGDGKPMPDGIDPLTGLPIVSLYGARLAPAPEDLTDIDTVVFDLPNIGCRFYTYLWTLTYVMEACWQHGKELLVLDRPNLISGNIELAEGPFLDEARCASFVGRWSIPIRHSCTAAELAQFWASSRMPEIRLSVMPLEGWDRKSFPCDCGLSFVPTSPAIVDPEAALLYPGLGLLEATNVSEGRGTPTPFRVVGAPWLDAFALSEHFNAISMPGVVARVVDFIPRTSKYEHTACRGVMLHVNDRARFRPVSSGMILIKLIREIHPKCFMWSRYPTAVNPTGERHLDKLLGLYAAESFFEQPLPDFLDALNTILDCERWKHVIKPFLLY